MKYSRLLLGLASLSAFAACEGEEIVKAVNDNDIAINKVDAIENVVESFVDPIVEEASVSVETPEVSDGKVEMVLRCGDDKTSVQKTYLAGDNMKSVFFSKDDKIMVWDGNDLCNFTAQTYGAKTTTFKGSAKESDNYRILYPAMPFEKGFYMNGKFTVSFPGIQNAVKNSFDPMAAISVATLSTGEDFFTLKNVTSLFKITPLEDFAKIELRSGNGESIAGRIDIDPADASFTYSMGSGLSSIVLQPASGEVLEANTMYCMNVLPQASLSKGLMLLFYDKDGYFKRQNLSTITSIVKNKIQVIESTTDYDGYYLPDGTAIKAPTITCSLSDADLKTVDPAGCYVDVTITTNVDLLVKFPSWIDFPVSVVPAKSTNKTYKAYIKPNYGTTDRNDYMTFAIKPFPNRGVQKTVIQKMDNAYPGLGEGDPIGTPKN